MVLTRPRGDFAARRGAKPLRGETGPSGRGWLGGPPARRRRVLVPAALPAARRGARLSVSPPSSSSLSPHARVRARARKLEYPSARCAFVVSPRRCPSFGVGHRRPFSGSLPPSRRGPTKMVKQLHLTYRRKGRGALTSRKESNSPGPCCRTHCSHPVGRLRGREAKRANLAPTTRRLPGSRRTQNAQKTARRVSLRQGQRLRPPRPGQLLAAQPLKFQSCARGTALRLGERFGGWGVVVGVKPRPGPCMNPSAHSIAAPREPPARGRGRGRGRASKRGHLAVAPKRKRSLK